MKTYIQTLEIENLADFLDKQIASLEDSEMFGRDDDLGLAHHYLFQIRKKVLLDLRNLPPEDE